MFILFLLWTPPLLASLLAVAARPGRRRAGWTNVGLSALSFAASVWLCGLVLARGVALGGPADLWRVDALSALLALCIAFVSMLASALGPGVEPGDGSDPAAARRFRIFSNAFALTMLRASPVRAPIRSGLR